MVTSLAGRALIIGVDRLDYSKGIANRLSAFELFLHTQPQWLGKEEESIHMAHVASIRIDTHLFFADVYIESSGGQNPIACYGHQKSDAVRIKELIEHSQTAHYKKSQTPTA